MNEADPLIRTKLRLPFTRSGLVARPRLQRQIAQGLQGPVTLITAPAGFGKTTLVASCVVGSGMPVAWLSLDKDDNRPGRFLSYLVAALQEADSRIGRQAAPLLASRQASPEAVLTSLINDLDACDGQIALVLDDYQAISSEAVHEQVAFLLEHCPTALHLVIATRSDPSLPLARWRVRGHTVELRAADLRFTQSEATHYLNDVMGLRLDAESVAVLEERTEGWIAGLQMAALSMRDREDVSGFIQGFSGTNRYIMDYLLEEVLASQPPEVQRFLLHTSILEQLSAPLCAAVLIAEEQDDAVADGLSAFAGLPTSSACQQVLEYAERAQLFLVPLDDERIWYRYHHLFADLLRTQLQKSLGAQGIARLHVRAADWHGQHGSALEAISHASKAWDDERVERFIAQHYMELVSQGEQSWLRTWTGKLDRELVHSRPLLCIYEAYSHSWFGELDEADLLLEEAERRIRSEISAPDAHSMQVLLAYVRSRVTAMRGDIQRAIQYCLAARAGVPAGHLALQLDTGITLGYEYFLAGDYDNAAPVLKDTVRLGVAAGAVINTVAAACLLARLHAVQGRLHESLGTYQMAAQAIPEAGGQHLGARALIEVGLADVLCEWNDLVAALAHVKQGLALLPFWDKADDWVLAYITLARISLALARRGDAIEAVERAAQLAQARGIFSEARGAVEAAQARLWLARGELRQAYRWAASWEERSATEGAFRFEHEVAHIARARVLMAQSRPNAAIGLLLDLEETARSAGRMGRVIEILLLKTRAMWHMGDSESALQELTGCLALAEPAGYVRVFLDEDRPMRTLLSQWLARASPGSLRDYAVRLLCQFDAEPQAVTATPAKDAPVGDLAEPLSQRELEVLRLLALGRTNKEIARQLVVAPGTVKAHTASIYRKLDVANRSQAVARARELDILP